MEKTTKTESTTTKKPSIEWTPILLEMGVLVAKGVIAGISYKVGEDLYRIAFTSKPKGELKLIDDYRKSSASSC